MFGLISSVRRHNISEAAYRQHKGKSGRTSGVSLSGMFAPGYDDSQVQVSAQNQLLLQPLGVHVGDTDFPHWDTGMRTQAGYQARLALMRRGAGAEQDKARFCFWISARISIRFAFSRFMVSANDSTYSPAYVRRAYGSTALPCNIPPVS